ncbi:hypothetical protein C8P69_1141 [Phreatobacter oligotrophus]|uniref:Uncharacterized protein n=2 Tax=Phreatobacter oligotrophus TaxID=1122261 RepID=A0A2T4YX61_9HYPH|nr:hypothetical protein C8P69_1141 [Phreatobacter oligotrophus]
MHTNATASEREKTDDEPAEPFSPYGEGYMPLTCAAQWHATNGLRVPFDRIGRKARHESYRKILELLASGKIAAVGDNVTGPPKNGEIPPYEFADCAIHLPDFDEVDAWEYVEDQPVLLSYAYDDMEAWRDLFDDQIIRGRCTIWRRIKLRKADIIAHLQVQQRMRGSGGPGRPTSIPNLIIPELLRRSAENQLEQTLAAEARVLSAWLAKEYPAEPQVKPRPCEIGIRHVYWKARGRSK